MEITGDTKIGYTYEYKGTQMINKVGNWIGLLGVRLRKKLHVLE